MFSIQRTDDLNLLLTNEGLWNELACGVPFRETSWLGPWWRHFGPDREAYAIIAKDDQQEIRGILPLYRTSSPSRGRTLSMIGDGDACSDHVSVLARPEQSVAIAEQMGSFLAEQASTQHNGWDLIDIDGVVEGDQAMAALARSLRDGGASLHAHSRMSTWFRAAEKSWEEHLQRVGKTQRRKMRRWSEQIEKTAGLEKVIAGSSDDVRKLLDQVIDLHQQRWNAVGESGSYADPAFQSFVREAAVDFFSRDRLYLPTLVMNGKTIGGELHFVGGDRRLYCYSSGFDLDFAELEPGRILTVETLLELYRKNLAGVDYLRGDEPYKERMSAEPRRVFRLRAIAPTWLPRLRHAAWCTRFEVKQWMRRRAGKTPVAVADLTETQGQVPNVNLPGE